MTTRQYTCKQRDFDFQTASRDKNFNTKFTRFQGPRHGGKQFSENARRASDPVIDRSMGPRHGEDRSARPIEGQVANYRPAAERQIR